MKYEKEIFDLFVDNCFTVVDKPFVQGDFVFATESHILIRVKKELCDGEYKEREKPNILQLLLVTHDDKYREVPIVAFEEAMDKIPLTDQHPECEDCDGSGEVDFEYTANDGSTHYRSFECPMCDGLGYLKNEPTTKGKDPEYLLYFCGTHLSPIFVEAIIKTAKMLGRDKLRFIQWPTTDNKGLPFIFDMGSDSDPSEIRIALMHISNRYLNSNKGIKSGKAIEVNAPSFV